MRTHSLLLIASLAAGLAIPAPARAELNLGEVISGLAESLLAQELDKKAYIAAQNTDTVSGYRSYLDRFPKGLYRANAERALARLKAPVQGATPPPPDDDTPTAANAEAQLGISFAQRVAVQRELTRLGYSTGGADGVWGRNTRSAILAWQRGTGQSRTGYLTAAQLRALLKGGPVVTPPVSDTVSAAQVEARLGLTRTQRVEIQKQLTTIGYRSGVADGLWGSQTRTAISGWQKANKQSETGYVTAAQVRLIAKQAGPVTQPPVDAGTDAALEERLLGLTATERADLQRRLTRLGYNTYGVDGAFGRNSRAAISDWQRDEAAPITGYLTADQVRLIRIDSGG